MDPMYRAPTSYAHTRPTSVPVSRPHREPLSSIQAEVGSAYTDANFYVPDAYHAPRNGPAVRFKTPSPSPEPPRPLRYAAYVTTSRIPQPCSPPAPTARPRHANSAGGIAPRRVGPLRLVRTLNSGAFGRAYAAHDTGAGLIVCVRVTEKKRLQAEDAIRMHGLLIEVLCHKIIAASAPQDRAHLMEMHGILQDDQQLLHVMPLMHCDLLSVVRGPCDKALTRRWIAQLALGIDALHRMGIIHRDIKPENVLLDGPDGNVRITDFNAAFVCHSNEPVEDGAVYGRDKPGSQPYMAWEVVQRRWHGKMIDWWSLGCLMYDLVTGKLLFRNESKIEKYIKWDPRTEGKSYLSRHFRLSEEEESVLTGLLKISPCERWQLRHLRYHAYFLDQHRANVFDMLLREAPVDLLTDRRAPRPEELEVERKLRDAPLCNAALLPRVYEDPRGTQDFSAFAWVNPHGLYRV
ncbi:Ribosomal protein S6 kinase alpha-2 [Trametes pubescens]|uniref:non-specific serine/threonine protein kinase n=1 Tax=Trametes pubescens TaxID=154538 RepID=A0A1M2VT55_TRAPU|nr:Ribosomal protein S6 kinase alpha-2 [Trametes pubescens]